VVHGNVTSSPAVGAEFNGSACAAPGAPSAVAKITDSNRYTAEVRARWMVSGLMKPRLRLYRGYEHIPETPSLPP
jgi:hypothetical protein